MSDSGLVQLQAQLTEALLDAFGAFYSHPAEAVNADMDAIWPLILAAVSAARLEGREENDRLKEGIRRWAAEHNSLAAELEKSEAENEQLRAENAKWAAAWDVVQGNLTR